MDGLLSQADTLCILKDEPDEKELEVEGGDGQDDEAQAQEEGGENSSHRTIRRNAPDDPAPKAGEAVRGRQTIRRKPPDDLARRTGAGGVRQQIGRAHV